MAVDDIVSIRPVTPIRRPVATCDPDVLALYERLVVAREGARSFLRQAAAEQVWSWHEVGAEVEVLIGQCQALIEALK